MVVLKESQGIIAAGIARTIDKLKSICGNPTAGQFNTIIENGVSRTVPAFAEIVTVNGTQTPIYHVIEL